MKVCLKGMGACLKVLPSPNQGQSEHENRVINGLKPVK
jgi:hypothetical protein